MKEGPLLDGDGKAVPWCGTTARCILDRLEANLSGKPWDGRKYRLEDLVEPVCRDRDYYKESLTKLHAWPSVRIELFVRTAFRNLKQKADAMLAARAKTPQHKEGE